MDNQIKLSNDDKLQFTKEFTLKAIENNMFQPSLPVEDAANQIAAFFIAIAKHLDA